MNGKELEDFMNTEFTLVTTVEYRRLLKNEKLLMSIQEGKDYNWLSEQYSLIEAKIEDMKVIKFDVNDKGETIDD
jgi:hypothetical protein